MRYFLTLSYLGTPFNGWQRQPNAASVQETLENALSTILRQPIEVAGCGRTDTGVHARYYVAHFDCDTTPPLSFLNGLNSLLPAAIAVQDCRRVADNAHARYDAFERQYEYHITRHKDPFCTDTAWLYVQHSRLDLDNMQAAAALLPQFKDFYPFCKTHSGVDSYACTLTRAVWEEGPQGRLVFHVTANRFLRGMVRLMVGACINAGLGRLDIDDIRAALETQQPLKRSLSVPPYGLFLTGVRYPYSF